MILGIVSLLGLLGGVALVLVAGVGVFYFFRALFPPYDSTGAEPPTRSDEQ
jgi:hypothetical protein